MNAGDIHALFLLSIIPLSLLVSFVFRGAISLRRGVLFTLLFAVLVSLYPKCLCGVGNNPDLQLILPLIAASISSFFISRKKLLIPFVLLLLLSSFLLAEHFLLLVVNSDDCKFTGDLLLIHCNQPVQTDRVWHTWLTGLYEIEIIGS